MQDRLRAAPALVGRDSELAELLAGLDDAACGSGRLFLLAGDPGIGKSRLAGEAAARARDRGIKVAWGRCWEAGGAPVYWPWVQALRALVRGLDSEQLRSQLGAGAPFVAQIVAEVAEMLPDVRPPPPMEAEGARFRLFDAVAAFLRSAGDVQPLMLVLDDLHAADAPSILLLRFAARELGDARVLVLGAYRDIELDRGHPLADALAELSREPATRHVPLSGLAEADVACLIQEITGVVPRESVVAAVHCCTEGNPLFVGEVARLLAAEGRLERAGDPAELRLAIPEGIRAVIGRRVARLPEPCGRVLGLAAMFGREFSLPPLEQLSGLSAGELLDVMDVGIAARLVAAVPGAPGRLRFSHALIRDALYEGIPAGQRLRLHQQAGEALEAFYQQDLDPHLAELAHHFFEAAAVGEAGKAVGYAERAGHRAVGLLAHEEAVRLFRMALAALSLARPPGADQRRCRLLVALGDALTRMGERQAAREELREAAGIARRYQMAEELGRAALAYAGFGWERGASDRQMIPLLQDARALLAEKEDAGPVRARVLAALAVALRDQSDRGPRDALSREAVALARACGDPPTLGYTLTGRLIALMGPGDPQGRLAVAEELRSVGRALQDKELESAGEYHRAMVFLETGRMAEYGETLDAVQRLVAELRLPASRFMATVVQASLALLEGRFADAEALVESALRSGASSMPWDAVIFSRVQRFALRLEDGRLAELEPAIRRSAQEFPTRPLFGCLLARLLTELGDEDQARSVFEQLATDRFGGIPVNNDLLLSLSHLAEVAWFLRDVGSGAVLHALLLPYRGLVVDTLESSTGAVDRYLGLAALTAGDLETAELHLRDALHLNARIGAQPWAARTRADLAALLLARDQPGDRERAIELLAAALGTARRLGMTAFTQRAGDVLARAAGGDSHPGQAQPRPARAADGVASWSVCRREGEYWSIAFAGRGFRLKDVKGLHYLAYLLRNPGREFHVLDLAAAGQGSRAGGPRMSPAREDDLHHARPSDIGPILDEQAKTAYRMRLRELEDDLAEATSWADPARAARARQEMQFLTGQLAAAVGLGGRDRRAGSAAERARVNITRAIRAALARIRAHSSALADHLDATIHTGTFCSYTPDPRAPITWRT